MKFNSSTTYDFYNHKLLKTIMRAFIFLFCSVAFSLNPNNGFSQNATIKINSDKAITIKGIFSLIKAQTNYQFIYNTNLIRKAPSIKIKKGTIKAYELLKKGLATINCSYEFNNNTIIVKEKTANITNYQQNTYDVKGKVLDESGNPIPGITIYVSKNKPTFKERENSAIRGTSTDFDGNFTIKTSVNFYLVATGINYQPFYVKTTSPIKNTYTITLKEAVNNLEEVIIVGYGKTSKEKATGSVNKIDAKVLQNTQNVSFADALIGIVPGMLVQESFTNPDTPPSILLRGVGSITASTEPLIVIDGVQMPTGFATSALNANDIKEISILKDASATSIYGFRGTNGVLLVTTKRGKKNNDIRVNINTRLGIRTANNSYKSDIMNASQKLNYEELLGFYNSDPTLLQERKNSGNDVDWSKLLINEEISKNHDISISGGSKNTSYYSSISYSDINNIFGSNYKRYTTIMRADLDITKRLDVSLAGNFANVNNKDKRLIGNPFSNAFLLNPWENVYDTNGTPSRLLSFGQNFGAAYNPLFIRNNTDIESIRKNFGGSINVNFKPFTWLKINGVYGINFNTYNNTNYENIIVKGGELSIVKGNNSNYTATLTASLNKSINQHNFNLVIGHEVNENDSDLFSGDASGFNTDAVQTLSASNNTPTINESKSHAGSLSYFSRINYSFKNTYNLSFSYRRDGSSRFAKNKKYANFWSIGTSWNIYKDLFDKNKTINNLKLRFSVGTSGNDFIGDFVSQSLYQYSYSYNNTNTPTLSRGANPNLRWEKNNNKNFGLDFGILNNRITGSFDYYIRTTSDLINTVPIPLHSGFDKLTSNIGEFKNKGFEVALRSINIQNDNFTWTTDINFANNKGVVTSLTEDRDLIRMGNIAYKKDHLINALYIADWTGVNPKTGFNQYKDSNGNLIDYNTDILGGNGNRNEISALRNVTDKTSIPKYHGGITNTFNYKNFDASFLFSFAGGNHIVNTGIHTLYNNVNLNQHVNVLNAWKAPGDQTDIAVRAINSFVPTIPINSDFKSSSQFLQNAGYIKLKSIIMGYTLDNSIAKKIGMQSLRFFAQGQNLWTRTDVDYVDPEFATGGGSIGLSSPIIRGFSLGINANF